MEPKPEPVRVLRNRADRRAFTREATRLDRQTAKRQEKMSKSVQVLNKLEFQVPTEVWDIHRQDEHHRAPLQSCAVCKQLRAIPGAVLDVRKTES